MSDDINNCESLIKNAKVLVTNLEIPVETALYSLKLAKTNNCKLYFIELSIKFFYSFYPLVLSILNFAPAIKNVDSKFFESTDILILNEVEVLFVFF
jgi:hypothetical protein